MESPALRYVLGLRDRIASPDATDANKALDKAALLDVLRRRGTQAKQSTPLCQAWGVARTDVLAVPTVNGQLLSIEQAIPGFYRAMLTARRGGLVGVLPGRTESHVKPLAVMFDVERRNRNQLVRADLAQGFTRYIQDQPAPVRRDAESAIARWMVRREPVAFITA